MAEETSLPYLRERKEAVKVIITAVFVLVMEQRRNYLIQRMY